MAIALYGTTNISVPTTTAVDGGTGANRCIVFATCGDISDNMSAVTWNGEPLTKALTQYYSAIGRYNYIWYLLNPTGTGTKNLVITGAGGGGSISTVMVYTGVTSVGSALGATGTGTAGTVALAAGSGGWIVGGGGNDANFLLAGTNTVLRSAASSQGQADTNGATSPTALNFTFSGSSANWSAYGLIISGGAGGGGTVSTEKTTQQYLNTKAGTSGLTKQEAINRLAGTTGLTQQEAWNVYASLTPKTGQTTQQAANVKAGRTGLSVQQASSII